MSWQRRVVSSSCYGVNADPKISAVTLGILRGYNRHAVRGQDLPALVPSPEPVCIISKSSCLDATCLWVFIVVFWPIDCFSVGSFIRKLFVLLE